MVVWSFELYWYLQLAVPQESDCCPLGLLVCVIGIICNFSSPCQRISTISKLYNGILRGLDTFGRFPPFLQGIKFMWLHVHVCIPANQARPEKKSALKGKKKYSYKYELHYTRKEHGDIFGSDTAIKHAVMKIKWFSVKGMSLKSNEQTRTSTNNNNDNNKRIKLSRPD